MDNLSAFLAENVEQIENKKVVISKRFKDKDGKPIEWEIKALTGEEQDDCQRRAMVQRNDRGRIVRELDQNKYIYNMIAAAVVFPDLFDAKLQDSYKVKTPEALLKKMLYSRELDTLAEEIREISDIEDINEAVKDAKN